MYVLGSLDQFISINDSASGDLKIFSNFENVENDKEYTVSNTKAICIRKVENGEGNISNSNRIIRILDNFFMFWYW